MASARSAAWARACSTALAIVSIHPGNLLGRRGKCLARVPSCVSMLRELGQATALLGWRIPFPPNSWLATRMSSATSTERSSMSSARRPQFLAAFFRGGEPNPMFYTNAVHIDRMVAAIPRRHHWHFILHVRNAVQACRQSVDEDCFGDTVAMLFEEAQRRSI